MTALGILWFLLIFVLIIGYFVLDGMDLGVGVLYPLLGKSESSKRVMLRAIGPFWDGNEVWLLTAGGALFAAFAPAYATSFSGFYLAIMLVLFGLILRAVAVEFRYNTEESETALNRLWDILFFVGSLLPALLFGVAVGNIIEGIAINANGDYTGGFFALLNPFALLCGVLGLLHILVQGVNWLSLKAELTSDLRTSALKLRPFLLIAEGIVFALVTILFFALVMPNSAIGLEVRALAVVFALLYLASLVFTFVGCAGNDGKGDIRAVISSAVGCISLVGTWAASVFPYLIAGNTAASSIDIAAAASSDNTLIAMTIIACIGVPLVLIYHVIIFRVFRGRIDANAVLVHS